MRCVVLEQSGLHQKQEPATFSGSHCCTSDVRLWLGARSVLVTPARPASSLSPFLSLPSMAPFAPKMCDLVLLECFHVFVGPKADPHSSKRLSLGSFDPSFTNPPVKSIATDTNQPRDLNRGVIRHK